jgi:hypothetical protein
LSSIRNQVFIKVVDDTHQGGFGKKNAWRELLWAEMVRRRNENELSVILFPEPPPTETVMKPRLLSQMWLDTAHEGEEEDPAPTAGPSSSSTAPIPTAQVDPGFQAVEEAMVRIDEESRRRQIICALNWVDYVPEKPKLWEEWTTMDWLAGEYINTFLEELTRDYDTAEFPRNMRLWIAETVWCFDALAEKGWTPRNLRMPHDRYIRQSASSVDEHIGDPGNLCFDVVLHVLRLWRYVGETRVEQTMRIAPQEYGARGNKSSKGPVNLRGNIIESLISDLQKMAVDKEWKGWTPKGGGRYSQGTASGSSA